MIETIKSYAGVVALVILAIMGIYGSFKGNSGLFGTAVDCSSNTCLSGGFGLTTGPFQNDGNTILNGTLTVSGVTTFSGVQKFTGALYASSTLQVSGTQTDWGNFTVNTTDTSTSTSKFGCIQGQATSTATPIKFAYYATTTIPSTAPYGGAANFILVGVYGNCP